MNPAAEDVTLQFLRSIKNCPAHEPKGLIKRMMNDFIGVAFGCACERVSRDETLLSYNFLSIMVAMIERCHASKLVLSCVHHLVRDICLRKPDARKTLKQLGIGAVISRTIEKEIEFKTFVVIGNEDGICISIAHVAAEFLPALPEEFVGLDLSNILVSGRQMLDSEEDLTRDVITIIRQLFPAVYNACRAPELNPIYAVLFLKIIYWAIQFEVLDRLIEPKELIVPICAALDFGMFDVTGIGLEIMKLLSSACPGLLTAEEGLRQRLQVSYNKMAEKVTIQMGIEFKDAYLKLTSNENDSSLDRIMTLLGESQASKLLTFSRRQRLINQALEFILPDDCERCDVNLRHTRLVSFVGRILHFPRNFRTSREQLNLSFEGIQTFKTFVCLVMETVDEIHARHRNAESYEWDMPEESEFKEEANGYLTTHLFGLPSFKRVISASLIPDKLRSDPLVRALRLLSILYEVNDNCGDLFFKFMSQERLIDRRYFISNYYEVNFIENESFLQENYNLLQSVASQYPFLLSFSVRQCLFNSIIKAHRFGTGYGCPVTINIKRQNLATTVSEDVDAVDLAFNRWKILFRGEIGTENGATKEFYTEFSKDFQRHDLHLWIGETVSNAEGNFIFSQKGIFPKPKFSLSEGEKKLFDALGMIMAKSILENQQMDLNFSQAFYKGVFYRGRPHDQHLTVFDIRDAMPGIISFIRGLVDALREKWTSLCDDFLTPMEMSETISNITVDGSSFDDLAIDFTVPGFPEMKMVENGEGIYLNIENIEIYLKSLIWCLLYKGPQVIFKRVNKAFSKILPASYMRLFFPDEVEQVLCGIKAENWTESYLRGHCLLEDRLSALPVAEHLFKVLSSLSDIEQQLFLKFVTSRPRLPIGGLINLNPMLTFRLISPNCADDDFIPTAMTCLNTMFITKYSSAIVLKKKLLLAITDGTDFFAFR